MDPQKSQLGSEGRQGREKRGSKIGSKKRSPPGHAGTNCHLPALAKEGDKGGGKPLALGIGGLEDSKICFFLC